MLLFHGFLDLCVSNVRKLVEPPYVDSIDWSIWHIFWLDERVVPKTHVDSNYKLAYDGFLSKVILTFFMFLFFLCSCLMEMAWYLSSCS